MRVRVIALLFAATCFGAYADDAAAMDKDATACAQYGAFGAQVMMARQANVEMSKLIGSIPADYVNRQTALAIVKLAYAEPLYEALERRQKAANDFQKYVEETCRATP